MATFHGIAIYEILQGGNILNGVYTNSISRPLPFSYDIDNEILRKKVFDNNGIVGIYDCRYIETGTNTITNCELVIQNKAGIYEIVWQDKSGPFFTGIGMLSGSSHLAVSYTNA